MPGHDPSKPPRHASDDRAPLRTAVVAIATVAWAATTFLPVVFPRIPSVPEIGPAFIAFLGAALAVPEVNRLRRRRGKDDDE
jgi:hypothetical protein